MILSLQDYGPTSIKHIAEEQAYTLGTSDGLVIVARKKGEEFKVSIFSNRDDDTARFSGKAGSPEEKFYQDAAAFFEAHS